MTNENNKSVIKEQNGTTINEEIVTIKEDIAIDQPNANINALKWKPQKSTLDKKENIVALLFITIPIIGFCVFTILSMILAVLYSFMNINPIRDVEPLWEIIQKRWLKKTDRNPWGMFGNYHDLFTHALYKEDFKVSITNTLVLMLGIPTSMLMGLLLAVLLSQKGIKGNKVMRMLYYLPAVSSAVAMNLLWRYVFNNEFGLVGALPGLRNINWLADKGPIKAAIIIKNTWGGMGGNMLLYLAGILSISKDYYEAADIDGASAFRQFMAITLPMLTPITFYMLIMGVIGGLQSYADAEIFAAGNAGAKTIVYFIWNRGINGNKVGLASSASILLAIVIMIVTVIQFRFSNSWVYED